MKPIVFVFFILLSSNSWAELEQWLANTDLSHANQKVRNTHILDEFRNLLAKHPLDSDNVSIHEIKESLSAAVMRAKNEQRKSSDSFLGFIYCIKVGINIKTLLSEANSNDLIFTYLIAGLLNEDNMIFYKSIKRIDRPRDRESILQVPHYRFPDK